MKRLLHQITRKEKLALFLVTLFFIAIGFGLKGLINNETQTPSANEPIEKSTVLSDLESIDRQELDSAEAPLRVVHYVLLGNRYLDEGYVDSAHEAFMEALAIDSDSIDALRGLMVTAEEKNKQAHRSKLLSLLIEQDAEVTYQEIIAIAEALNESDVTQEYRQKLENLQSMQPDRGFQE